MEFRVHAIRRMYERRISEDDVREVIENGKKGLKEENKMKCVICKKGETTPGYATVTLEREGTTQVFKDVPASVCENCGEEYIDEETTDRLLKLAEAASKSGVEVDIRKYIAA